jgi:excisionase family DNA binding protein
MKAGRPKDVKSKEGPLRDGVPVMDAPEVCGYLHIHRSTLYRLIKRSEIPFFKIGSDYRFNREEIDAWMRGLIPAQSDMI